MTADQQKLLFAAYRLAERGELYRFEPERIAAEAGMPADSFGRCFAQEREFWLALHRLNVHLLVNDITRATDGMPPGRERLKAGVLAYWDGCVRTIPVRAIVRGYRKDPDILARLDRINWGFAHMLSMEMKKIGWERYNEAAQIAWFMAEGVVRLELEANGPLPDLRQTFWDFLAARPTRIGTPAATAPKTRPKAAAGVKAKAAAKPKSAARKPAAAAKAVKKRK
ncbi:hypothetical protein D0B54_12475 [Solimonas sp. K1W22B-7]|uniref:hypothetical protein n=1 Tax=Solimonas sp. K1W22B-7 TaxID=2303331 RepID=UPI000E3308B7|nr:hypothetical protein [Solimonas sp. K1W22B-7]AXQ29453.1 hypothetical protein D0B54_12475 [Solimonas sp. K1W22B-7]